ncbi:MAG: photosynthetic reaction center subunit H [Myxococcaceae bacterium]|jgi:photosynthetic reaction center H subunit|nr:photosynthetic reaction center subunit H [Myxococcaceae bacterium]
MHNPSIDVAQVLMYVFWAFFLGLIYWLRMEDRREGYPLETDRTRRVGSMKDLLLPTPKTFLLPEGGTYTAPNYKRDEREINARRTGVSDGSTSEPLGDPLTSNVGPAAYADRHDAPEHTRDGRLQIVPMRVGSEISVLAGSDPRGWRVVGGDGKTAGTVKDLWVDRADLLVRYLEVELGAGANGTGTRLVPMPMAKLDGDQRYVEVYSILAKQFGNVPTLKNPEQVTVLEEEKVSSYYAAGRLWAEPRRMEPLL